jgi:hypothetical protein
VSELNGRWPGGVQSWVLSGVPGAYGPRFHDPGDPDDLGLNAASVRFDRFGGPDVVDGGMDARRNIRAECGIPESMPSDLAFLQLYHQDSMAGAVVDRYPEETFKSPPEIWDSGVEEQDEVGPLEEAIRTIGSELRGLGRSWESEFEDDGESNPLWRLLCDWDKASRVTRYGILLLGIDDGLPLSQPAAGVEEMNSSEDYWPYEYRSYDADQGEGQIGWPNVKGMALKFKRNEGGVLPKALTTNAARRGRRYRLKINAEAQAGRRLLYARTFTAAHVSAIRWERNKSSPRYGMPTSYFVDFGDPLRSSSLVGPADTAEVHWTRVIHLLSDGRWHSSVTDGVPALWPVLPEVLGLQKIRTAAPEGYWLNGIPMTAFGTPPAVAGQPRVVIRTAQIRQEWERLRHSSDKMGIFQNLTPQVLQAALQDPATFSQLLKEDISVALRMPMRKLMGSERGELASSEDEDDWNDVVRGRQRLRTIPEQIVPLVDRFRMVGLLPPPKGGTYRAGFPAVDALTRKEKSEIFLSDMQALAAFNSGGGDEFYSPEDVLVRYTDATPEEAAAYVESAAQYQQERVQKELDQQVEQQTAMIDEGLAPDPTEPSPDTQAKIGGAP